MIARKTLRLLAAAADRLAAIGVPMRDDVKLGIANSELIGNITATDPGNAYGIPDAQRVYLNQSSAVPRAAVGPDPATPRTAGSGHSYPEK